MPLKRNTTLIRAEKLDENLAPVKIKDKQLLGSKKQIDGKFFYLFKDLEIAGKESVGNYQKHLKEIHLTLMNSIKIINFLVSLFLNPMLTFH
nr:hypothetical protein [Mycoplasmopsis bovis]